MTDRETKTEPPVTPLGEGRADEAKRIAAMFPDGLVAWLLARAEAVAPLEERIARLTMVLQGIASGTGAANYKQAVYQMMREAQAAIDGAPPYFQHLIDRAVAAETALQARASLLLRAEILIRGASAYYEADGTDADVERIWLAEYERLSKSVSPGPQLTRCERCNGHLVMRTEWRHDPEIVLGEPYHRPVPGPAPTEGGTQ